MKQTTNNKNFVTILIAILFIAILFCSITINTLPNNLLKNISVSSMSANVDNEGLTADSRKLLVAGKDKTVINQSLNFDGITINIYLKGFDSWWPYKDHLRVDINSNQEVQMRYNYTFFGDKGKRFDSKENTTSYHTFHVFSGNSDGVSYKNVIIYFDLTVLNGETRYYQAKLDM